MWRKEVAVAGLMDGLKRLTKRRIADQNPMVWEMNQPCNKPWLRFVKWTSFFRFVELPISLIRYFGVTGAGHSFV